MKGQNIEPVPNAFKKFMDEQKKKNKKDKKNNKKKNKLIECEKCHLVFIPLKNQKFCSRCYTKLPIKTPIHEKWNFEKYLPDAEDIEANIKINTKFFKSANLAKNCMNETEREHFLFGSGFIRGMSWMQFKMENKK